MVYPLIQECCSHFSRLHSNLSEVAALTTDTQLLFVEVGFWRLRQYRLLR